VAAALSGWPAAKLPSDTGTNAANVAANCTIEQRNFRGWFDIMVLDLLAAAETPWVF